MIISEISDSQSPEKPQREVQEINIYQLIPQAKPIISPTRKYASQKRYTFDICQNQISNKSPLFKKQASISNGYIFSSFFESGNIQDVQEKQFGHFYLKIKSDSNSKHQSQWFYFQIKGLKKAKFTIYGFKKPESLYNSGMKLCIKQDKWKRGGSNISYCKQGQSYAVKFDYVFKNPNQITQIAYCYPYTYTDLQQYISNIFTNKNYKKFIKKQIITQSYLKNQIYCLIFNSSPSISKPIVFITARVHPGQTVSSYVLKGIIDTLLLFQKDVQALLKNYEIRIIPMLNPDGVKLGNYRFSYTGRDLNREWDQPSQNFSPQILQTKAYLQRLKSRICMVIDLHGHSRKKDVFFYGCSNDSFKNQEKKFPYLMSKICEDYSFLKSNFKIQKDKKGTARISLWKLLKIPYIYTLQCSFCGSQNSNKNFIISDLEKIGRKLVDGLTIFFSQNYADQCIQKVLLKEKYMKQFQMLNIGINQQYYSSDGSDSEPSQGKLEDEEIIKMIGQKKQKKSKKKTHTNYLKSQNKAEENGESKQNETVRNFRKRISTSVKSQRNAIKKQIGVKLQLPSTNSQSKQSKQSISNQIQNKSQITKSKQSNQQSNQYKEGDLKKLLLNRISNINYQNIQYQYMTPNSQRSHQIRSVTKILADTEKLSKDVFAINSVNKDQYQLNNEGFISKNLSKDNQNLGAQYIRVKNYAERISKLQKLKADSKLPLESIILPPATQITKKKKLKDLKLNITPIKLTKNLELNKIISRNFMNIGPKISE